MSCVVTYDLGHIILSCTLHPKVVSPKEKEKKRIEINNNLAIFAKS